WAQACAFFPAISSQLARLKSVPSAGSRRLDSSELGQGLAESPCARRFLPSSKRASAAAAWGGGGGMLTGWGGGGGGGGSCATACGDAASSGSAGGGGSGEGGGVGSTTATGWLVGEVAPAQEVRRAVQARSAGRRGKARLIARPVMMRARGST